MYSVYHIFISRLSSVYSGGGEIEQFSTNILIRVIVKLFHYVLHDGVVP